ncbi:BAX protein [hydrothermal vent metagenome]|uniref:BAX protein n=1 Tax=hydrothermal vent metagenome TaxID=652676 RepID=A0A1W1D4L0_9ZZZZ
MKEYYAKDPQDLLVRMKPHPISITLAQAAIESGWGTSRLFRVANNAFGVWSFKEDEPRVPAYAYRHHKQVYLKKYNSIADSIRDYYKTIATSKVFYKFRAKTMQTPNPYTLVKELDKYSERKYTYTHNLTLIIKHNKFLKYDKYEDE